MITYYDKAKCSNCNKKQNVQLVSGGYFVPEICEKCGYKIAYIYNEKEHKPDKPKWAMQVIVPIGE